MIGTTVRFAGLLTGIIATAGASFAHPGHDHSHSDHAVYDMSASSSSNEAWIIVGLISAAICLGLIRRFKTRDRS